MTGPTAEQPHVPLHVRLLFGRAAAQVVADRARVHLLHIKGAAVDTDLRPLRAGSDVDVLVRPAHAGILDRALRAQGWQLYSTFEFGSPFGHAQTYSHRDWGYLDVHRFFPGIRLDPAQAFSLMWRERGSRVVGGVECAVPDARAQRLLLLLNAARGGGAHSDDVTRLWTDADSDDRESVVRLAEALQARVALAAATGDLDHHRGEPDHRLWEVITEGGSRSAEWWARLRAARTWRERADLMALAPRVDRARLARQLGHAPSRQEIIAAYLARPRRAIGDVARRPRREEA